MHGVYRPTEKKQKEETKRKTMILEYYLKKRKRRTSLGVVEIMRLLLAAPR
jgi:hypothetical protein